MRLIRSQQVALTLSLATFALAIIAFSLYEYGRGPNQSLTTGVTVPTATSASAGPNGRRVSLPSGCTKPQGGYLIITDEQGFNDSIAHGAPTTPWPVITVKQGSRVDITVCNADTQAHGFQVNHYFDSSIKTVDPASVVRVSFVADKAGTFEIYCSIFCTIHIYMQNGQLRVLGA